MNNLKFAVIAAILVFLVLPINSQNYKIDYSLRMGDLEWNVQGAQKNQNNKTSAIFLSVKNIGTTVHDIQLEGTKVYLNKTVFQTKYEILSENKAEKDKNKLSPEGYIFFRLDIPGSISNSKDLSILIGDKFLLNGIDLTDLQITDSIGFNDTPLRNTETKSESSEFKMNNSAITPQPEITSTSWDDYIAIMRNQDLENSNVDVSTQSVNNSSWEDFYEKNRSVKLTHNDMNDIYETAEEELAMWEKKGEFETTNAWKNRVTPASKKKHKESLILQLIDQHEKELKAQNDEKNELRQQFDNLKNGGGVSASESGYSDLDQFTLMPYNADNQCFLIRSQKYGDITLYVPLSEAESFKKNWDKIKEEVKLEFTPVGDQLRLTQIKFNNGTKTYIYTPH